MRQKRCVLPPLQSIVYTLLLQTLLLQPAGALRLQHLDVILVGPQYASNVGSALRLCACFEVGRLKLVAPEYDREQDATYERRFAMPQGRAVRDARTTVHGTLDEALADVDFSLAFSRRSGASRTHEAFAAAAPALARRDRRTALVFGREADGLTTAELARCGGSVEIASADSLNLSHAVSIALADIYGRAESEAPAAPDVAPDAHIDALVARLGEALGSDEAGFRATSRGKVPGDPRLAVARRLLRRAAATSAEVGALHGILGDLS